MVPNLSIGADGFALVFYPKWLQPEISKKKMDTSRCCCDVLTYFSWTDLGLFLVRVLASGLNSGKVLVYERKNLQKKNRKKPRVFKCRWPTCRGIELRVLCCYPAVRWRARSGHC